MFGLIVKGWHVKISYMIVNARNIFIALGIPPNVHRPNSKGPCKMSAIVFPKRRRLRNQSRIIVLKKMQIDVMV
jgi:hypothetical protein